MKSRLDIIDPSTRLKSRHSDLVSNLYFTFFTSLKKKWATFHSYLLVASRPAPQNLSAAEAAGIYLNNCPQGLHGPIEILSQTAFSDLEPDWNPPEKSANNRVNSWLHG